MTIYVDPFWAGVTVGVLLSTALFVGLLIYIGTKDKNKKGS